ncbi:unnamed protein product [Arabidopsis halleri]
MKLRPGLNEIYNMLDQDESQRLVGFASKPVPSPAAFQTQGVISDQNPILLAQGNFKKPKCSHCNRIGHTVDKCYKVHGYPPGHPRAKQNSYVGTTNLASIDQLDITAPGSEPEHMSKDHIQQMISYLSTKLQSPSITSCPDKAIASTSNSVPTISQITGFYQGIDAWKR